MNRLPFALMGVLALLAGCGSSSSSPTDGPADSACPPVEAVGCQYGYVLDERGCFKQCEDAPPDGGPSDHTGQGPADAPAEGPADAPADYVCPPNDGPACPNGYVLDEHGCAKGCKPLTCQTLSCTLNCANGLQKDLAGCDICACQPPYSKDCGSECFAALYASCTPAGVCKYDTSLGVTCYSNGVRIKKTSSDITLTTTDGTTTCFTEKEEDTIGLFPGRRVIYRNAMGTEVARWEDTGRLDPILTCGTTQVAIDHTLCPGLLLQQSDGLPPLQNRMTCTDGTCP